MNLVVERLAHSPDLKQLMDEVFGDEHDPIEVVDLRAQEHLRETPHIVWEGSAETFQFSYVSASAESILGHPCQDWIEHPTFWADRVVHPQDVKHAISYCAMATGQGADHDFEYRAVTQSGEEVLLHDIVRVVKSPRGIPVRLRGIMLLLEPDRTAAATS
jgi:PAS domain-containing protein